MHELSLMKDFIHKIESVARAQGVSKVVGVHVRLGALCHISPNHFVEHFIESSVGTVAEGADLEIDVQEDITHPHAQDVLLDKIIAEE